MISGTSCDARHPLAAIVDGDAKSYWCSTGLFPQEVVLRLPAKASIARIRLVGTSMRHLKVERCDGAGPTGWQPFLEYGAWRRWRMMARCRIWIPHHTSIAKHDDADMPETDGLQDAVIPTPGFPATHLKVKVTSGIADFITIRSLEVFSA